MPQEKEPLILADGHVHIHECFDRQAFFKAALSNFYLAAAQERAEDRYQSVLFLTEGQGREIFPLFSQSGPGSGYDPLPGWSFRKTREADSLVARNRVGQELFLIAGYQIVTAEGLEVLALGADPSGSSRWPTLPGGDSDLKRSGRTPGGALGVRQMDREARGAIKKIFIRPRSKPIFPGGQQRPAWFYPTTGPF